MHEPFAMVQVCYASLHEITLVDIAWHNKLSVGEALRQAALKSQVIQPLLSAIVEGTQRVGIFSKIKSLEWLTHAGDRIEIYRPLLVDPKESRRARAHKKSSSPKKSERV